MDSWLQVAPNAAVLVFFLANNELSVWVFGSNDLKVIVREWCQLLNSHDCDILQDSKSIIYMYTSFFSFALRSKIS